MKRLIYLLLICCSTLIAAAQTAPAADQEKLLEFYQTQRYAEAAAYLQTIYGTELSSAKELTQIAYTNMMAGNLVLAEKYYLKLYEMQPKSLPVLFNLASISQRRGNTSKSKQYYQEIIKIDSTNFNVYRLLASMYTFPLAPEKLYYLKKANTINPTNADVAFDLASSLNLDKKNDSAYVVLEPALAVDSNNMMLLKAKLPICLALKKLDEALLTGEKLFSYGDSSTYVLLTMGRTYFTAKRYQKALNMFKLIESSQQQNESSLYYMAMCYRELKDYPNSERYMKQTIKEGISQYTSVYYKTLGEIYEKKEQVKNANQSYTKSLEFENNGEVYYNLALLNDGPLANKKLAVKYYKEFLRNKPDPEKYKEVIVYVQDRIKVLPK